LQFLNNFELWGKNYSIKLTAREYNFKVKLILLLLATVLSTSFLSAEMPSFKFTFGSNLGNIPIEINNINKNVKKLIGVKINKWVLSPNFSSFAGNKILSDYSKSKNYKKSVYIKFRLNF
jgi:hypothetical protein|tara:strand:- start:453 stop:812 length:360 start_codon:yes stop_codon:yes gene_type:complete